MNGCNNKGVKGSRVRVKYYRIKKYVELGTAKKDIAEIKRMLKALIKSLENKHLTGLLPENTDF